MSRSNWVIVVYNRKQVIYSEKQLGRMGPMTPPLTLANEQTFERSTRVLPSGTPFVQRVDQKLIRNTLEIKAHELLASERAKKCIANNRDAALEKWTK
jgi:hypothetical protein